MGLSSSSGGATSNGIGQQGRVLVDSLAVAEKATKSVVMIAAVTDVVLPEQRPLVSVGPAATSAFSNAVGRARWTVPAAEFSKATCRFDPAIFCELVKLSERDITMDACAESSIHAVATEWRAAHKFLQTDCSGHHTWLDAPQGQTARYLEHYLQCKATAPHNTSALIVVPKDARYQQVAAMLHGMRLLKTYSRGIKLYIYII